MDERPLRLRRFRLILALAVAMFGAAFVQSSLAEAAASMRIAGDLPTLDAWLVVALVLYGLVFALAYWIAPKWG